MEDRRILGYHTDGNKVPLTYSRDAAARPLSILESLISEIHKGEFLPHSTRSGRFKASKVRPTADVIKIEDDTEDVRLQWKLLSIPMRFQTWMHLEKYIYI